MKVTLVMVDRRHLQAGFVLTEKPEVNWRNQTFTLVTFGLRVNRDLSSLRQIVLPGIAILEARVGIELTLPTCDPQVIDFTML